jgi:UDP-N-acetylmuramoyl-tripeptide--D-alanyl-D-alanine ligase
MIPTSFSDLAAATGSRVVAGDASRTFTGVSTDTRTLKPGDLYFSLSGPNFDGNAFTGAAIEGGAAGALVRGGDGAPPFDRAGAPGAPTPGAPSPGAPSTGAPILAHPDPRSALADFAAWHRARLAARVVGVTGSCGKTTTKNVLLELLRAAVDDAAAVVGSPNSFNNDIGVPHTLFMAGSSTAVCVVEMGTNHPGEIENLCRIARPSGGIVTNVGAAHLEGLRSIEGVAREKGSLVESLPADGFCVLNADSPFTRAMRERTDAPVITFSVDGDGDLDARDVWFHAAGTTFRLGDREVTSPLLGLHNVQNLLAALAA